MVEDRIVVGKLHIVGTNSTALALGRQDVTRVENFGDEHRSLALGRGREEMQVLPDGAANGARNSDVMFETGPAPRHGFLDELLDGCAALGPEDATGTGLAELVMAGGVPDDQAAKPTIPDQHIGAESEKEVGNV